MRYCTRGRNSTVTCAMPKINKRLFNIQAFQFYELQKLNEDFFKTIAISRKLLVFMGKELV